MPDYPIVRTHRDGASLTVGFCRSGLHLRATVPDRTQEAAIVLDTTLTDDIPSLVQAVNLHAAIEAMICHRQTKPALFCLGPLTCTLAPLVNGGDTPWAFLIPDNLALNAFRVSEDDLEVLDRALAPWVGKS